MSTAASIAGSSPHASIARRNWPVFAVYALERWLRADAREGCGPHTAMLVQLIGNGSGKR